MKKVIKLCWIDDMESWANSAQDNLKIVADKYAVDLKIVNCKNGDEIKVQLNYDFAAVIMDYHMKPYNGDKYIQEIRFEEHLDDIPILFYSQDNTTDLQQLVKGLKNVIVLYRPNLEDKIIEMFVHG